MVCSPECWDYRHVTTTRKPGFWEAPFVPRLPFAFLFIILQLPLNPSSEASLKLQSSSCSLLPPNSDFSHLFWNDPLLVFLCPSLHAASLPCCFQSSFLQKQIWSHHSPYKPLFLPCTYSMGEPTSTSQVRDCMHNLTKPAPPPFTSHSQH